MNSAGVPLLSCRGVSKYFGAMAAVKDLSFDLESGKVLGVGGPNGAGKTTLFEVISGLNPADVGEISLEGRRIDRLRAHSICHLGIARVFQSNAGFDTMTARQNVLVSAVYGLGARDLPPLRFGADAQARTEAALELVGFRKSPEAIVSSLPVLDRKLLMIASAIVTQPKLLLMDEPVGGLNPDEINFLMELVRTLIRQGITIMLIEHVMRFLVQLSTRVIIMHHGEKIYEGLPADLARDETVKRVYLGDAMSRRIAEYAAASAP